MSRKYREGNGPGQAMLMPADPRHWLPAGHLAWRVLDLAGEMDLSGFGASYRAARQGARPYHPQMMATLLLYCYCRGRRSSREIEMATYDDVGARVIAGGLHPDHSTIATIAGFVRANLEAVCALLPESVRACPREGLVSLDLVAGDGTKLKANASMAANVTAAQMDAQIAGLEAVIDAEFRGWVPGHPRRRQPRRKRKRKRQRRKRQRRKRQRRREWQRGGGGEAGEEAEAARAGAGAAEGRPRPARGPAGRRGRAGTGQTSGTGGLLEGVLRVPGVPGPARAVRRRRPQTGS